MPARVEVTGEFIPHVAATDSLVVDPVGNPVDCDLHFGDVGVEIAFGVPLPRHVGVDEQQENTLERPALWVTRRLILVSLPLTMGTIRSCMTRSYANSLLFINPYVSGLK